MEDSRTRDVMKMTVALLTSGNPHYNTRTIGEVSAEILGNADGVDHVFGICNCGPDEGGETVH